MCSSAFFAFLRIGEITTTKHTCCLPLQINQLEKVYDSSNQVVDMKLTFLDFKHNYNQRPFTLVLHRQPTSCPIQLLLDYFALRGNKPGAIFETQLGSLVTRDTFVSRMDAAIRHCGLDPARYKGIPK